MLILSKKKSFCDTHQRTRKQASFRTMVIGVGTMAVASCSGGQVGLNSKHNMQKQEFIAEEQRESVDGKLLNGDLKGKGNSG